MLMRKDDTTKGVSLRTAVMMLRTGTCRRLQDFNCGLPSGLSKPICYTDDGGPLQIQNILGAIRLWSLETGGELRELEGHSSRGNDIVFSYISQLLGSALSDKTVGMSNSSRAKQPYVL